MLHRLEWIFDMSQGSIRIGCWQDVAFAVLLIYGLVSNYALISEFKQLPSPIYGGDYYHHLGMMYHLERGGSPFENSLQKGETPWIPPLYHYLVIAFAKLSGSGIMAANLYSSLPFMAASLVVVYALSKRIFHNNLIALVPVAVYLFKFPVFKYSYFTIALVIPLALYLLLDAFEKGGNKRWVLAGVGTGLVAISHAMAAMVFAIFAAVLLSYQLVFRHVSFRPFAVRTKELVDFARAEWPRVLAFVLVAGLIAQFYWFQPIFRHRLSTANTISEYDQKNIKDIGIVTYTLSNVRGVFFGFSFSSVQALFGTLQAVLFDLGIVALLLMKKREPRHTFLLLMLAGFLLSAYHFIVTLPLLGREFFPALMQPYLMEMLRPLLIGFGLLFSANVVKSRHAWRALVILFIAALFLNGVYAFREFSSTDRWYSAGRQPVAPHMAELSDWVRGNTGVEDVFISTNEISFMLNSLTGNKVVNSRRAHSGMYTDVEQRWADSAVILYGNNTATRNGLIQKYGLKYLYWQADWIPLDYTFDQSGQLVGWFDPLLVRDIRNYSAYLEDNGVKFYRINTWLDPTNRFNDDVKKFDVLFVVPSRWNATNPWDPSLDDRLVRKKDFFAGGEAVGAVYEVV